MENIKDTNRRNFISTTAAFAATAAFSKLAFAGETSSSVEGVMPSHKHHGNGAAGSALVVASLDCVAQGEACLQHCFEMMSSGDTSMAKCAKSVREMMIYCGALSQAAIQDSKRLKQLAKIAAEACEDCEAACREHAKKHETCKRCADSCAECLKQCKALPV